MYQPYKVPISVKGIIFENEAVWLRKNERGEWELPGGKLDKGEQPEAAVVRELREELGFETEIIDIVQVHLYSIKTSPDESKGVLIISYLCRLLKKKGGFEVRGEAGKARFKKFSLDEVLKLNMPQFYKDAILKARRKKRTRP